MSTGEKAFGLLKSIMLMTERFDAIDAKVKTIASDQAALARSHAELAQRVAALEGYIRGRADQAAIEPRLLASKE